MADERASTAEIALAIAAVAAGLLFRFWTTSHLWLDEALTVNIAKLPIRDIPNALRRDGHPPLYYFLLHFWMRAFGDSDFEVRALSGLFAVATLPLAWVAGKLAGGRRVAVVTVAFFALSPFAVRYATEARMYSMVMVLVLIGYILVVKALVQPRLILLIGIAIDVGLLVLSHYWAVWLIAAVVLVLLFRAWRNHEARSATVRVLIAAVIGGLALVPWLPVMAYQSAHTGTPWAAPVRPVTIVTNALADFGGGGYGEAVFMGMALLLLFVLGLCGVAAGGTRVSLDFKSVPGVRREAAIVALTIAIASVVGYATHTTFASRYASAVLPLFILVCAYGLTRIESRTAGAIALAGFLAFGVIGSVHSVITERTEAYEVSKAIKAGRQPNDLVVMCPDQIGPDLNRELPTDLAQVVYPTFGDPHFVDWRDYAKRNAAADPEAFADLVKQRADELGSQNVWFASSPDYKTLEGQCEALTDALAKRFPNFTQLLDDDSDFFEHEALFQFKR
jgi:uncharacterized membrane protein